MSYSKQTTVPDTSSNMAVAATPLDPATTAQPGVTRLCVVSSTVVWVMYVPNGMATPSAADVLAGGAPLSQTGAPIQLLDIGNGYSSPDLSRYFLATASGVGDVRAIG